MYIRNTSNKRMINLDGVIEVWPHKVKYSNEKHTRYQIRLEWPKHSTTLEFETEEERDNFLERIASLLKPNDIDPTQKPLNL